jgi:hypothetical protein
MGTTDFLPIVGDLVELAFIIVATVGHAEEACKLLATSLRFRSA